MNLNDNRYSQYALVREMMDTIDVVKGFDVKRTAQVASASATADDWAILAAAASTHPDHHHIKVVCLAARPSSSTILEFFAFSDVGQPLGTINLKLEDSLEHILIPFDADSLTPAPNHGCHLHGA